MVPGAPILSNTMQDDDKLPTLLAADLEVGGWAVPRPLLLLCAPPPLLLLVAPAHHHSLLPPPPLPTPTPPLHPSFVLSNAGRLHGWLCVRQEEG